MSMTMAEKILARASGRDRVAPGDFVTGKIDMAMVHEGLGMGTSESMRLAGVKRIWDPARVVALLDHYVPAPTVKTAEMHQIIRTAIDEFGIEINYGESQGVCHQVMIDNGHVLPGRLIVGTDSHTTTYGALGAAGTGIGFSEMAYVLGTGELWFRVPETVRFVITGELQPYVGSKDVALYIAGKFTAEVAQYRSIEFTGPTVDAMSIESRITMSNMAVELGAKFGFCAVDDKTAAYLSDRTDQPVEKFSADPAAAYERTEQIDVSGLMPQVAMPYSVDNVSPLSEVGEVVINQAVLGSCTNGRYEDLAAAAEILKGRQVHPRVRLLVIPASVDVYRRAMADGLLSVFLDSKAIICNPSCGPCFGQHMGQLGPGEVCVASINRNFKGRMGSPEAKVYLASPVTVAASAVEGRLSDPGRLMEVR